MERLQQGMRNVSAIFQEKAEDALRGLTRVKISQDDVLVFANNNNQWHLGESIFSFAVIIQLK